MVWSLSGLSGSLQSLSGLSSGLVIALVVSLVFILLLRFTAGLLLWLTILSVLLVVAYGQCVCVCVCVCLLIGVCVCVLMCVCVCSRYLALLLGAGGSERAAWSGRHHRGHRPADRRPRVPAAQPDLAHLL